MPKIRRRKVVKEETECAPYHHKWEYPNPHAASEYLKKHPKTRQVPKKYVAAACKIVCSVCGAISYSTGYGAASDLERDFKRRFGKKQKKRTISPTVRVRRKSA